MDGYIWTTSSIFACFLDASKAFDRVCHNILFDKLATRRVPSYILKILEYWYASQTFNVRRGNIISDYLTVTNDVRQSSILSPYLFNVYMNELRDKLNKEQIECFGGNKIITHLMYADDVVIMASSSAGLNTLIEICESFGSKHCVKFNPLKSAILIFRSKLLYKNKLPNFSLNNQNIQEVNKIKYLGHICIRWCRYRASAQTPVCTG